MFLADIYKVLKDMKCSGVEVELSPVRFNGYSFIHDSLKYAR